MVKPDEGTSSVLVITARDLEAVPENEVAEYNGGKIDRLDVSHNSLTFFSLPIDCGITTTLTELILDNNCLVDDHLDAMWPHLPNLGLLSVNNNQLRDADTVVNVFAERMPALFYTSFFGNPMCRHQLTDAELTSLDYRNYRLFVLSKLTSLRFLDHAGVSAEERAEAAAVSDRRLLVPTVIAASASEREMRALTPAGCTSLAAKHQLRNGGATGSGGEKGGAVGGARVTEAGFRSLKYEYKGKNSEGNRFIRDDKL